MRSDRIEDGFWNRWYCCLMDDVVRSLEESRKVLSLSDVGLNDLGTALERFDVFPLARREVIDHPDGFITAKQFFNNMRPNEPRTPGNNVHRHQGTSDEITAPELPYNRNGSYEAVNRQ